MNKGMVLTFVMALYIVACTVIAAVEATKGEWFMAVVCGVSAAFLLATVIYQTLPKGKATDARH